MVRTLSLAALLVAVQCLATAVAQVVSEKEAAAFGEKLAKAFNERDLISLNSLIDFGELGLRAGRSIQLDEANLRGFVAGVREAGADRILKRILGTLEKSKGIVKMTHVVRRDGEFRPILRFDSRDDGFDYAEYILKCGAANACSAVDWFQLTTSELFSATLGVISRMLIDPNPGLLKTIFNVTSVDHDLVAQFKRIGEYERQGDYRKALASMDKLPAGIAQSRILMVKAVQIASASNDDGLYRDRLAKLAQFHSKDPLTAFTLIDHYYYLGDIDGVIQRIADIEGRVGRDGLTELLKANMYHAKGDFQKTLAHGLESIKLEPDRSDSYFRVALGYVGLGRYRDAVKTYQTLASEFGYEFERASFKDDPAHEKFLQSPEFKAWLEH